MYIKKIEIKNIRAIEHFVMEFEEGEEAGWHVLLGDNGSGKTSVLKATAVALLGKNFSNDWISENWIKNNEDYFKIELEVMPHEQYDKSKTNQKVSIQLSKNEEVPRYIDKNKVLWDSPEGWFSMATGPLRYFASGFVTDDDFAKRKGQYVTLFERKPLPGIDWITYIGNLSRDNSQTQEERTKSKFYLNIVEKMINEWQLIEGVTFSNVKADGLYLIDRNGVEVSVYELSDGYQSALSLFFEIIRQMVRIYDYNEVFKENTPTIDLPGVVIIDEIDAHLHPSWQTEIGDWFLKYFPKLQFIVTTHSPLICRACHRGTIWKLPVPGGDETEVQGKIEGTAKNRLIYGDVLSAYGTDLFGEDVEISLLAKEQLDEIAELSAMAIFGKLDSTQERKLKYLKNIHSR